MTVKITTIITTTIDFLSEHEVGEIIKLASPNLAGCYNNKIIIIITDWLLLSFIIIIVVVVVVVLLLLLLLLLLLGSQVGDVAAGAFAR